MTSEGKLRKEARMMAHEKFLRALLDPSGPLGKEDTAKLGLRRSLAPLREAVDKLGNENTYRRGEVIQGTDDAATLAEILEQEWLKVAEEIGELAKTMEEAIKG